jgi:hypothetical protein
MTHDQLLAKIDSELVTHGQRGNIVKHSFALRAVVELHKPDVRGNCDICSWVSGGFVIYSLCPTLNAIKKELQ